MIKNNYISNTSEWSFELLEKYDAIIGAIAKEYGLKTFPNQIEVITSEQMIDYYSAVGMPLGYFHWSFGKQFHEVEQRYRRGYMGLAYELVINSNPCITYLMEENSLTMQAIVIAHACYGHNSFFKNNYLFKSWTNPNSIIDYLLFSKKYIAKCEDKHGIEAVEMIIDACHALMNYGVDRYHHPAKLSLHEEKSRQKKREEYLQTQVNELWRTIPKRKHQKNSDKIVAPFPDEPQENILYFIEKNAPNLEPWQREVVRIVRKIAQYFYPQKQTKVMNEGWACFWHYILINELYNRGHVDDKFMLEFLQNHTNVIKQPAFDDPYFSGINPYTLGFGIFMDIKRICENPTKEDKEWFPNLIGTNWLDSVKFAMENFKDESFISQYLSPKLIRDLKLFSLVNVQEKSDVEIVAIHNEEGYRKIREELSAQYNLSLIEPNIQVVNVDHRGDRSLTLRYIPHDKRPLAEDSVEVMKYLHQLWGFNVKLEEEQTDGTAKLLFECPGK